MKEMERSNLLGDLKKAWPAFEPLFTTTFAFLLLAGVLDSNKLTIEMIRLVHERELLR